MAEELDHGFFEAALSERLPTQLQDIIRTFSSFDSAQQSVVILDADAAVYFAHEHPRSPESSEKGLLPTDSIRVFSDGVDPATLRAEIAHHRSTELLVDLRSTDDKSLTLRSEQLVACCMALEDAASDDEDQRFILALVDADFLIAPEAQDARDVLLSMGTVAELFDCDEFWFMEWSGGHPSAGTQLTSVPAVARRQMFVEDLSTWDLSRWGRFLVLPAGQPWKWSSLPPAAPTFIQQSIRELNELDPNLPAHAAAYMRIATLEIALFRLVQLCLGESCSDWWPKLDVEMRGRLSRPLERTEDLDDLPLGLTFADFQKVVRSVTTWPYFQEALDPGGKMSRKNALEGFDVVEGIRNRVMHPIRLLARPIRPSDLQRLDDWLGNILQAIDRTLANRAVSED